MLNRSVLIITPAEPYLTWAKAQSSFELTGPIELWTNVYLIPEFDTDEDPEVALREVFPVIFARMLCDWTSDERVWPENRTLDLFKLWFRFEMHTMVEDVCDYEIEDDEDE